MFKPNLYYILFQFIMYKLVQLDNHNFNYRNKYCVLIVFINFISNVRFYYFYKIVETIIVHYYDYFHFIHILTTCLNFNNET